MINRKAVIVGIKGTKLTYREKKLFKKYIPWGIILFSRNIKNIYQLRLLVDEIKKIFKDSKYPILIDQEGGKVSRLNKIVDFSIFSQSYFGNLYKKNKKNFFYYYKIYIDKVSDIFKSVGININTVPVLDIRRKYGHNIIGDRSFSDDSLIVSRLGNFCIKLFKENNIATVIKHIPGHGLSNSDSHLTTPVIKNHKTVLIKKDFKVFKKSKALFAMTAHIIYSAFDPINVATHSRIIIKEIIRKKIGFKGILISDDISMKALKRGIKENTIKAINAGCNLVLHCNGNINEIYKILKIAPKIDKLTKKKTSQFYKFLR
tara:strand:- start:333 stop:1283 length:951 start_codon:yes stop_codon:yes gene_type:complete